MPPDSCEADEKVFVMAGKLPQSEKDQQDESGQPTEEKTGQPANDDTGQPAEHKMGQPSEDKILGKWYYRNGMYEIQWSEGKLMFVQGQGVDDSHVRGELIQNTDGWLAATLVTITGKDWGTIRLRYNSILDEVESSFKTPSGDWGEKTPACRQAALIQLKASSRSLKDRGSKVTDKHKMAILRGQSSHGPLGGGPVHDDQCIGSIFRPFGLAQAAGRGSPLKAPAIAENLTQGDGLLHWAQEEVEAWSHLEEEV